MRFSMKSMLAVVALVAVSISGLLYANAIWAAAFFTGALAFVLFSVVATFLGKGASRAFWLGCAIFGAGYFGMALMTHETTIRSRNAAWSDSKLVTTHALLWSEPRLRREGREVQWQRALVLEVARLQGEIQRRQLRNSRQVTRETLLQQVVLQQRLAALEQAMQQVPTTIASELRHFLQVGHSIFTLPFALVGGWLGSWFYRRQMAV